jgi:hypothetical protein
MTDTTTDDELAALLASGAWQTREFAYTGTGLRPGAFVAEAAETVGLTLTPALRERPLTAVRRHAVDDLVAFKRDHYDGPPAEYAFIWKATPERVALAFDYTHDETARIRDFIAARGVAVPESLASR